MINIYVIVSPYPSEKMIGFRGNKNACFDITSDGLQRLLDMLQGLDKQVSFVVSDSFRDSRPALVARIEREKHTIVSSAATESRFLGRSLSEPLFNYLPTDIFKFLTRRSTLVYRATDFSEALYDPMYIATRSELRCAGQLALSRLAILLT